MEYSGFRHNGQGMNGRQYLLRPSDAYLLSFLVPVIVMLVIFFARGIFPFGEESFLRTDMYHQYAPFFSEFQYKLQHGGSLLYTWDVGLGVNFSAIYAYYLASPLNLLLLLLPRGLVIEFMTYLIVIKIGLCSLAATYYFRKHFKKNNFSCAIFGILYAMSGYIAAYSWNIMWLDCIILFPLVMLGLERLYRGESPLLYIISLGLSIFSNYYISIMTCIFLVIYFAILFILDDSGNGNGNGNGIGIRAEGRVIGKKAINILRTIAIFAISSLLAGGLAALALIPEIYALASTASADIRFPSEIRQYFTVVEMFSRHMVMVETEQGLDHWPNIYCGAVIFMLMPVYFLNRRITLKSKLIFGLVLVFFYMSFSLNLLNFLWHGLHYPNSLPCRQGYIYVLIVLTMCYEAYLKRKFVSIRDLGAGLFFSAAFIFISQKLMVEDEAFSWPVFYVTLVFALIYFGILYLERMRRVDYAFLQLALLIFTGLEAAVNMAVTSVTTTSRTAYISDRDDVRKLVDEIQEEDRDFYRFEKVTRKAKDDGAFMQFPSVSIFSSTAYKHCSDFFKAVGCEASTNAYSITGSTPLVNMLFSVRYDIFSEETPAPGNRGLSYVNGSGKTFLYRSDYALPLGFMAPEVLIKTWDPEAGTPAVIQNRICELLEANPVLVKVAGEYDNDGSYKFIADADGEYYVYMNDRKLKKVRAKLGDKEKVMDNLDRGYFMEMGYLLSGMEIDLKSESNGVDMDCDIYRFDYNAMKQVYDRLNRETWNPDVHTDTRLSGSIETQEGGTLLTSIPYDKGWSVYVDDEYVEAEKALDTFIGIPLSPGKHEISMSYYPEGLTQGIIISILSLLLTLAFLYVNGHGRVIRRQRRIVERQGRISEEDLLSGKMELKIMDNQEGEGGVPSISQGNVVELWKNRENFRSRRRFRDNDNGDYYRDNAGDNTGEGNGGYNSSYNSGYNGDSSNREFSGREFGNREIGNREFSNDEFANREFSNGESSNKEFTEDNNGGS